MKKQYAIRLIALSILVGGIPITALVPASYAQDTNRREMMHQKMQEKMQQSDTNGDGVISREEFMAQAEARFAKMDKNGDGNITKEDMAGMRDKFKAGGMGAEGGGEQFP